MKLFIGNLPFDTPIQTAAQVLAKVVASDFTIATSYATTVTKGHCFVSIASDDDALVNKLNQLNLEGRKLRVEVAKAAKSSLFQDLAFSSTRLLSADPQSKAVPSTPAVSASSNVDVRKYTLERAPCPIIDIGANLTNRCFKDPMKVVAEAEAMNVTPVILTGTSMRASQDALKLAQLAPSGKLFSTVGVHPHEAKMCNKSTISTLRRLAEAAEVIAIGETGLDYNRNHSPPDVQREWFRKQVELAIELNMPLFCHEREAADDFQRILSEFQGRLPPLVVHCYTGDEATLAAYVAAGYYIGVTGFISMHKRGRELRNCLARVVPLDRLMIETDAPYMTPDALVKTHGRNNSPANLPVVLATVADLYGQPADYVATQLTANTRKFFGL